MKAVSWDVAFRKLKEWQEKGSLVSVGNVLSAEVQGETISIFGGGTTLVIDADTSLGIVALDDGPTLELAGASFRFSGFEDSPFEEADLGPDEFEEQLEAEFPDGRLLVFAKLWDLGREGPFDKGKPPR